MDSVTTEERQRTRRTAEERRIDVLNAAMIEFATYGLHGASTVTIAERAGISQPYVLRLFETKKQLFLETVAMARRLIETTWTRALEAMPAEATPETRLQALGEAFQSVTSRTDVLRLLLQAYSAAADADVREQCQRAMRSLFDWVRSATGVSYHQAQMFFAQGMLIMVGVSIGAPEKMEEDWARAFILQEPD